MKVPTNLAALILLLVFCLGLFIGTRSTDKTTTDIKQTDTNHTVITTIKKPDGTVQSVTTIDSKTDTRTSISKVTPVSLHKTNISALAAFNVPDKDRFTPVYGISVSRQVIGPFTAGLFGLTDGTVGISVGINF